MGLKIEVEFSPIYEGQPLFGAVDEYLRGFGFMLFDLSRNRYRRSAMPHDLLPAGNSCGETRSICGITVAFTGSGRPKSAC